MGSTSFSPILEGCIMQQVLGVFLLAAVSTKANSNVDSHGSQDLNLDTHGSQNSSRHVQSRGTRAENGCWQIKYYYRSGSYSDVFFYTDFDDTLPADLDCADGCVYMRLGDHDGSRHCFTESTDEADEVKEEYTIPKANCEASSRGL